MRRRRSKGDATHHGAPTVVVVAARAVVVASIFSLVAVAVDQVGLHVQRVLVVVAALRRDDVVELAAALVRVVFLWVYRRRGAVSNTAL